MSGADVPARAAVILDLPAWSIAMVVSIRSACAAACVALAAAGPLAAQQPAAPAVEERLDLAVARSIRDEGLNRSHVDSLAEYLSDVIGPRLTGSTGMRRADEWVTQMFRQWGLSNVA